MTPPVCVLFRFEGRGQTRYMGVGHRQSDFVSCILYLVSLLCCLVCISFLVEFYVLRCFGCFGGMFWGLLVDIG